MQTLASGSWGRHSIGKYHSREHIARTFAVGCENGAAALSEARVLRRWPYSASWISGMWSKQCQCNAGCRVAPLVAAHSVL